MSYDTTVDIESVLAEVRQPVRQYSLKHKHEPGQPESNHTSLPKTILETEDLQVKERSIHNVCVGLVSPAQQTLGTACDVESTKNDSDHHQSIWPPVNMQSLGCRGKLSDVEETSQQ